MLKYKTRRYFEYITLKTPILSIMLAAVTFFLVFLLAGSIYIDQYYRTDDILTVSDEDGALVGIEIPQGIEYDMEPAYAYLYPADGKQRIRCSFIRIEKQGIKVILFFKPDEALEDLEFEIELVIGKITLARRLLGDFTDR